MHTKVNRGILMAAALLSAAAGLARAQYETDTLPPGVAPRGGPGAGVVPPPAPTPPDRIAPVVPQPLPSASAPASPQIAPTPPAVGSADAVA